MDLSILVVNWNTRELLRRCVESIEQTVHGLEYQVIIVDNGSTDGSLEMLASAFAGLSVIRNPDNRGFARATNQAIRASQGRYVLLLNSDAAMLEGTASRMVEFLDSNPRAAAVGGMLLNPDGSFQNSFADFPSLIGELMLMTSLSRRFCRPGYPSYDERHSQQPRAVDWVSGALLMARREALDRVGLLDEDYFMYVEEVDWCFRAWRAGWQVHFVPDAKVVHSAGASYARVPERKRAQLYRSKWLFMRKHGGWARATAFHFLVRVCSTLKLIGWVAIGLSGAPQRRELARQNVVSYQALLAQF